MLVTVIGAMSSLRCWFNPLSTQYRVAELILTCRFRICGAAEEKSAASEVGFCAGNVQERLAIEGTQQTTGLVVRYKVIKVSWLLSGEDLVG